MIGCYGANVLLILLRKLKLKVDFQSENNIFACDCCATMTQHVFHDLVARTSSTASFYQINVLIIVTVEQPEIITVCLQSKMCPSTRAECLLSFLIIKHSVGLLGAVFGASIK